MLAFTRFFDSSMHIVIDHATVVKKCCRQVTDAEGTLIVVKITYIFVSYL